MANERKIIVEIISTKSSETVEKQDGSPKEAEEKNNVSNKNKSKKIEAMLAVDKISSIISSGVRSSMNRYFSMSENYMAEMDFQNAMTVIGKGRSFASTVFTAARAGSTFGPGGAAVGAIISAAAWVGNEYVNYQQRMSNYYQNLNATNYQTEFDRTRLGLTNEGKGTEN